MTFEDAINKKYLVFDEVGKQEPLKHDELDLRIPNEKKSDVKLKINSKISLKGKVKKF